ncbi:FTN-2 protein [Aphelenchoides avenae]|nr:FTN-2 protein [Aphelenchus avenae]
MTSARQNYSADVEVAINEQINNELAASYQYMAMANYFARVEVALPGAAAFFKNQSVEERNHAQKLIDYQNDRGGRVVLHDLRKPAKQEYESLLEAFKDAVALEKANNEALLRLHAVASEKNDPDLTNFLEEFYLREQVIEIQQMARKANQLERIGQGLGEHLFDQELLSEMAKGAASDEKSD